MCTSAQKLNQHSIITDYAYKYKYYQIDFPNLIPQTRCCAKITLVHLQYNTLLKYYAIHEKSLKTHQVLYYISTYVFTYICTTHV